MKIGEVLSGLAVEAKFVSHPLKGEVGGKRKDTFVPRFSSLIGGGNQAEQQKFVQSYKGDIL